MKFKEILRNKKFIVTAEVMPPKGTHLIDFWKNISLIKDYVDAINITDNQRAVMRSAPLAGAALLAQEGLNPIWQVTGRDRNSLALESDVLAASILKIENILVVTGDYPDKNSSHFPKPVYELDSVGLIQLIKKLQSGFDLSGSALKGSPSFTVGASANPGAEPSELHLIKLWKKVAAGAEFFQTQPVYDPEHFQKFIDSFWSYKSTFKKFAGLKKPLGTPRILAGIFPLISLKTAHFLNQKLAGIQIPGKILTRLEKSRDPRQTGIEIALELIAKIKTSCDGIHLMAMGHGETIQEILRVALRK